MSFSIDKAIRNAWVRQEDQNDCGVACLKSIISFYKGDADLESLRRASGTSRTGTTMLGLYQAAPKFGLIAEAYEADIENLAKQTEPCILHVVQNKILLHYIVCYGFNGTGFIISDPADGITVLSSSELETIWQSRALLLLKKSDSFVVVSEKRNHRLKWLWNLAEQDVNILSVALMLGLVIAILGLASAIFTQKLIDVFLPEKQLLLLVTGLSLMTFLLIARSLLSRIRMFFLIRQSRGFNNRMIGRFYGSLMRLPFEFFSGRKTGDLIARMNDTQRLQTTITYLFGDVIIDVLIIIVSAAFVAYYSSHLAILLIAAIPIFMAITWRFNKPVRDGQIAVMQAHAMTESQYVDTIQGIEAIKGSGKESTFTELTLNVYQHFQQMRFELGRVGIRFQFLNEVVGIGFMAALFGLGSWMVLENTLQLGALMALIQMGSQLLPAASRLSMTNLRIQEAKVAFDRMYAFTSLESEQPESVQRGVRPEVDQAKHPITSLHLENITFRFPGRKALLEDVNLEVHKGEMIGILGESGSGKTTLLQLIERLYPVESGRICINESISAESIPLSDWRRTVGVVPQQVKIFNTGLLQNVAMDNVEGEADVHRLIGFCKEVGLHELFMRFPQGYATLLGEEGVNISGGQRQLVGLARALYSGPKILLLDEATSAMDRITERMVLGLLEHQLEHMAMIWVTHRIHTLSECDRIYILDQGRIQDQGTATSLMERENSYSQAVREIRSLLK